MKTGITLITLLILFGGCDNPSRTKEIENSFYNYRTMMKTMNDATIKEVAYLSWENGVGKGRDQVAGYLVDHKNIDDLFKKDSAEFMRLLNNNIK